MLDRILDFLFRKTLGVCLSIASAVMLMLTLTSCIPLDFCACWCGAFDEDCGRSCEEVSVECDDVCFDCFGGEYNYDGGYSSGCAVNQCLFGKYGCESECGNCYTDCGGVNLSCWEAACTSGTGVGCTCDETADGFRQVRWLNCITYCNAKDDPDSPKYQPDYLYSIWIVDYYGNREEFKVYSNTYSLPYDSVDGMYFEGYYSEPNGGGTRYGDGIFPGSGTTIYAYYRDSYTGINFTINIYNRYYNPENGQYTQKDLVATISTIHAEESLKAAFREVLPNIPAIDNMMFKQISAVKDNYYNIKIGDSYGISDEYDVFHPIELGFHGGSWWNSSETMSIYLDYSYIRETVTLYYSDYGTSKFVTLLVEPGTTLEELYPKATSYIPSRIGEQKLAGFSTNNYDEYPLDKTTVIDDDITLYAVYRDAVTISFDDAMGSVVKTYEYYDGELITLPVPESAPLGEQFDKWANETLTRFYQGEMTVSSDMNGELFTAMYKTAQYTVTLMDGEREYMSFTYNYGVYHNLPTPTDDFRVFVGWYDNPSLSGSIISNIQPGTTGDLTLYAKFEPKKFTVEMDTVGGTLSGSYEKQVSYGQHFTLPVPTRTGYKFGGWYYYTTYSSEALTDESGASLKPFDRLNGYDYPSIYELDVFVFAKWIPNTYTVTFSGEGITTTTATYSHGTNITEPTAPTRKGYNFVGWYNGNVRYDFENTKVTGNITLAARFEAKVYTINLVISDTGASFQDGSTTLQVTYEYGSGSVKINGTPVRDGFAFTGWRTQAGGGGELCIRPNGDATTRLDALLGGLSGTSVTLYASWTVDNN